MNAFREALCREMGAEVAPAYDDLLTSAARWARGRTEEGLAKRFAEAALRIAKILAGWEGAGLPTARLYDGLAPAKAELVRAACALLAELRLSAGAVSAGYVVAEGRLLLAARAYAALPEGGAA